MASELTGEAKKKKEDDVKRKAERARDGAAAMAQYEADARATREKTARLRELRLAKEAVDAARLAAEPPKPAKRASKAGGVGATAKAPAKAGKATKAAKGVPLSAFLTSQNSSGRRS